MSSFKLKLVAYFGLLALLPLVVAFFGFSAVAERSEIRRADSHLEARLRAALAAYEEELDEAERDATVLAGSRQFQEALLERDARRLRRILAESPHLRVHAGTFRFGIAPTTLAAERSVAVLAPGDLSRQLGMVIAAVALDSDLVARLQQRSGLDAADSIALVKNSRIVAAPLEEPSLKGSIRAPPGRTSDETIGGKRYRTLVAGAPDLQPGAALAVLTPYETIEAANASVRLRLLLALLATLLLVSLVAYLEGRSIVRTIRELVAAANGIARGRLSGRVPVRGRDELALLARSFNDMASQLEARLAELESERRRLRDATMRFGDALAATHDIDKMLCAIVETAVESTRAAGGVLVGGEGDVLQAGDPDAPGDRVELPLRAQRESYGTLVLNKQNFSIHDLETASTLVGQAVIALENARLHQIVERQALTDGLTRLANRRRCEDALATEIARSDRFGEPVAIVLADLDHFKVVNDAHGHAAGDAVLRQFADVLRENVREIDLACRWGGEEFALILPATDSEGGAQLAERIRTSLAERTMLAPTGAPVRVTASFGIASYPPAASADRLLALADDALYTAKRAGRDRVVQAAEPAPSA